jgi:choline dehydrogenase-like flavoprotein
MDTFDYVIAGGGSAGSVLAHRLTRAGATVCVMEAGSRDRNPFIHVPAGFVKTLHDPAVTWRFQSEPGEWTGGRRIDTTQGKVLGGSSSVNGMVFVRGQPGDYDGWAQRGNRGWSYAEVLPYFKRLERRIGPGDDRYRGRDGALPVTDPDWRHPLCDAFIAGAGRVGFPQNPDYNGATQEGAGYYQRVIERARRVSAARAFLYPAMSNGVEVRTDAPASAIVFDGRRAVGVRYLPGATGPAREVGARKEVIVACGTFNSPKLLQLSGVGPGPLLQRLGIEVRHALAGVGENLSDHYTARIVAKAKGTITINNLATGPRLLGEIGKWLIGRPSILGLSAALVYAFGKSRPELDAPDFTVIFSPASYREGYLGKLDRYPGMTAGAWQMRPLSTGHVRIASADPLAAPLIQPNYLDHEEDRRVFLAAVRAARRILATPELAPYYEREQQPGADKASDDELLDFARRYGVSCYHYVGTCRMGPASDSTAVVDQELRVHGLEALRVVDASVMPTMTSANTYASTLMIAEKASDLILGRTLAAAQLQPEAPVRRAAAPVT